MIAIKSIEDAKAAAKRLQNTVGDGPGKPKLAVIQGMLGRTLGYKSWEDLTARFDAATLPSEEAIEAALRKEVEEHCHAYDERTYSDAIDAVLGAMAPDLSAEDVLMQAPASTGFRSMMKGTHPLIGVPREGRYGRIKLEGNHSHLDAYCFINAHFSETRTIRVVDLSYEVHDEQGLAACLWGTAFVPYGPIDDHEAIDGADEASDDDVRVITSVVADNPGFFEDGEGLLVMDGIETRQDQRRKELATSLLITALNDLEQRWPSLGLIAIAPERIAENQPSHRVPPDVRNEVEAIVFGMIDSVANEMGLEAVSIRMLPERGRLQTLADVHMVLNGGEPGIGTHLAEEELERRMRRLSDNDGLSRNPAE